MVTSSSSRSIHAPRMGIQEQPQHLESSYDDEPQPVTDDEREDWTFADASTSSCSTVSSNQSWGHASIQGVECELLSSDNLTSNNDHLEDNTFVSMPLPPRPHGLLNLGNTCYFNAAIQMLLSLPAFTSHLCTHDYLAKSNEDQSRDGHDFKVHIITEAGSEDFGGTPSPSTPSSITGEDTEEEQSDETDNYDSEEAKSKLPLVHALTELAILLKRFGHDVTSNSAADTLPMDDGTKYHPQTSSAVSSVSNLKRRHSHSFGSYFSHRKSLPAYLKHSSSNNVIADCSVAVINPRHLKSQVDNATDLFHGHRQQDAHEFLITLLDLLHEEMTKASKNSQNDGDAKEGAIDTADIVMLVEEEHTNNVKYDAVEVEKEEEDDMVVVGIQEEEGIETEANASLLDSLMDSILDDVDNNKMDVDKGYVHISPTEAAANSEPRSDKEVVAEEKRPCTKAEEKQFLPTDHFHMEVSVNLSCISCTYTRSHVELYNHLSFEVNPKLTVDEALKRFFAPEQRDITCDRCGCKSAKQTMEVLKSPRALLLHFKRFTVEYDSSWRPRVKKNQGRVEFKDSVSLCSFMANRTSDAEGTRTVQERQIIFESSSLPTYRLKSVVHHIGSSANCGHYVADALQPLANPHHNIPTSSLKHEDNFSLPLLWHRFSDSVVTPITWKDVSGGSSNSTAYMLMYELNDTSMSKLSKGKKGWRYLPKWLTRSGR